MQTGRGTGWRRASAGGFDPSCPICQGALRARYSVGQFGIYLDPDNGQEMSCRTCWGTGREPISPELRGKMAAELSQYIAPKLRAIEHSSSDGTHPPFVIMEAQPDATSEEWERRNNRTTRTSCSEGAPMTKPHAGDALPAAAGGLDQRFVTLVSIAKLSRLRTA